METQLTDCGGGGGGVLSFVHISRMKCGSVACTHVCILLSRRGSFRLASLLSARMIILYTHTSACAFPFSTPSITRHALYVDLYTPYTHHPLGHDHAPHLWRPLAVDAVHHPRRHWRSRAARARPSPSSVLALRHAHSEALVPARGLAGAEPAADEEDEREGDEQQQGLCVGLGDE